MALVETMGVEMNMGGKEIHIFVPNIICFIIPVWENPLRPWESVAKRRVEASLCGEKQGTSQGKHWNKASAGMCNPLRATLNDTTSIASQRANTIAIVHSNNSFPSSGHVTGGCKYTYNCLIHIDLPLAMHMGCNCYDCTFE